MSKKPAAPAKADAKKAEPAKKKGANGIATKYVIKDGQIERKLPFCNRCGRGYFMADHGDRMSCGNCGFTIFKNK